MRGYSGLKQIICVVIPDSNRKYTWLFRTQTEIYVVILYPNRKYTWLFRTQTEIYVVILYPNRKYTWLLRTETENIRGYYGLKQRIYVVIPD